MSEFGFLKFCNCIYWILYPPGFAHLLRSSYEKMKVLVCEIMFDPIMIKTKNSPPRMMPRMHILQSGLRNMSINLRC